MRDLVLSRERAPRSSALHTIRGVLTETTVHKPSNRIDVERLSAKPDRIVDRPARTDTAYRHTQLYTYIRTDREREINKQRDSYRRASGQTDRQITDRQTSRHIDGQTDGLTD